MDEDDEEGPGAVDRHNDGIGGGREREPKDESRELVQQKPRQRNTTTPRERVRGNASTTDRANDDEGVRVLSGTALRVVRPVFAVCACCSCPYHTQA